MDSYEPTARSPGSTSRFEVFCYDAKVDAILYTYMLDVVDDPLFPSLFISKGGFFLESPRMPSFRAFSESTNHPSFLHFQSI